jgi:hypothetical protein
MPTVPLTVGVIYSDVATTGYVATAKRRADNIAACIGKNATDANSQMALSMAAYTEITEDEAEITFDFDFSGASVGDFVTGEITYPDDWHGAIISFTWYDDATNRAAAGNIFGPTIEADALGTISGGAYNGQAYHVTRDRETGEHNFGLSVNTFVRPVDGTQTGLDSDLYFDWGGSAQTFNVPGGAFPDTHPPVEVPHTFATFGDTVTVYPLDEYGQRGPTLTIVLPPICAVALVESRSPFFVFDFAGTYDPDSSVAVPVDSFGAPDGDGHYTVDLSDYADTLDDDTTLNYACTVRDDSLALLGVYLYDQRTIALLVEAETTFGVHIDQTRCMFTAAPDEESPHDIRVRFFKDGSPTFPETRYLLENHRGASLWGSRSGALYMSAQNRETREYHVFRSVDSGRSFTQITMTTMWGTDYKKGLDCGLPIGGGAASVALRTVDGVRKLMFKRSNDGDNWPEDAAAVQVAETATPSDFKSCQVRQVPGKDELRVTIGTRVWKSTKLGKTGSWEEIV